MDNQAKAEGILNLKKPVIRIRHSELTRFSPNSFFRSGCKVCEKGLLLVRRNFETLQLEAGDFCVNCGQRYIYTDIDEMRKREG